ncbi:hypothetical protein [Actinoplanes siamensis]|uniref:Septum formation initiator n=1 Tax=Actinoplanes siamensis TaxID=1223317 RepID=A0A919N9B4_9ACTN|nr:hypothetical protein [Actinoplanes siamensis]GIF06645.1 hypothetical protein Asi03nite_41830 [Actinoplanes siamensis]
MSSFGQRMVIVAGWVVAAILAVLVGVVGIGLVGLTDRDDAISEAQVERELAEVPATPSRGPQASIGPAPATTGQESSFRTRGGTVVADCRKIVSMSPAQGFAVHEQSAQEGEFRSVRDGHDRVRVKLACVGGTPRIGERDDG